MARTQDTSWWVNSRVKRIADVCAVVIALPWLLLLTGGFMLAILIIDRAKPLIVQRRIGKDGVPFPLTKLTTTGRFRALDPSQGINSPHVTRLGKLLRLTIIDETPQLIVSVLRGDMSVVGPRPLLQVDIDLMKKRLGQREYDEWLAAYTACTPGWTGKFGQASRMFTPQSDAYLRARKLHDISYLQTATPWMDFKIVLVHFKLFYIDLRYRNKMKRLRRKQIKN